MQWFPPSLSVIAKAPYMDLVFAQVVRDVGNILAPYRLHAWMLPDRNALIQARCLCA
jgi:hypothetical protein